MHITRATADRVERGMRGGGIYLDGHYETEALCSVQAWELPQRDFSPPEWHPQLSVGPLRPTAALSP
jgi:hypothetical protein